MKKAVGFAVLAMVLVLIASCAVQAQSAATDAQRIVGSWTQSRDWVSRGWVYISDAGTVWVFNANGTGTAAGDNFTFGISANGQIFVSETRIPLSETTLFFSPDGRRMFIGRTEFTRN